MISFCLIVVEVLSYGCPQGVFAKEEHSVQTFFLDRLDESLGESVQVWRTRRQFHRLDSGFSKNTEALHGVQRSSVADQVSVRFQNSIFGVGHVSADLLIQNPFLASGYGVADDERFYSLSFNTRDVRTMHGSRRACGSSRLTSSLRNKKAPGLRRGLLLNQQGSAYRLTWRLVPPPGAPLPGSPLETTLTQSESLLLKYEVSLALRSASRLS